MSWKEVNRMSLRKEFVLLAQKEGSNVSELCRRFGISRKTGYKWIQRHQEGGEKNLEDRSRRPKSSPRQTAPKMVEAIETQRGKGWGGRKIRARLIALGHENVPAPSTITAVLRRRNLVDEEESRKHQPYKRFAKENANELWQIDYKGDFPTLKQRCHPLSVVDDSTRFLAGLSACGDQRRETAQACLEEVFRRYGMPLAMLMDNGSPWGGGEACEHTRLSVWLMRLGIRTLHGRPYHPQTQGKVERFHRTLKGELLNRESFLDLAHCQRRFDEWREEYNYERPHEALGMATPGSRYTPSPRTFPETLPAIEYAPGRLVRKVQHGGRIAFHNREYRVGHAFIGLPVALHPTEKDGIVEVYFCRQKIKTLDLHSRENS